MPRRMLRAPVIRPMLAFLLLAVVTAACGRPSLHDAAKLGNVDAIKQYAREGANVNVRDAGGLTPLYYAVSGEHLEAVKELVRAGADVNLKNKSAETTRSTAGLQEDSPLHTAVRENSTEILQFLLAHGADLNARNSWNATPLHEIDRFTKPEIVEMLIERGADVNAKDKGGGTPLDAAETNEEVANLLRLAGAVFGSMRAVAIANNVEALRSFFSGKKPSDAEIAEAFRSALLSNSFEAAEFLLKQGAHVNDLGRRGDTLLHLAASLGRLEQVEFLLKHGADPAALDKDGDTPLALAELNWRVLHSLVGLPQRKTIAPGQMEDLSQVIRLLRTVTQEGKK